MGLRKLHQFRCYSISGVDLAPETILIRGARQLLTLRGPKEPRRGAALQELGIIHDGSLLIRGGVLQEVGPTRRVENLAEARDAVEINAAGRVVMPGFVDSHTHLVFPLPGSPEDPETGGASAVRASTGKRLESRARPHLEAMARHGTTTVEVKTGCGPDEAAETKLLRVLGELKRDSLDLHATVFFRLPAPDLRGGEFLREAVQWFCGEFLPKVRKRRLARIVDLAWDDDSEGRGEALCRCLAAARSLGFSCKIHAAGTSTHSAIEAAIHYGAISIDHLEHAPLASAAMLAQAPAVTTLLPGTTLLSGGPDAPARAFVDAGAAPALATNFNPFLNPMLNMQTAVSLACLRMGLTAAEAISAATINGAYALGHAAKTASLEFGKSADLVILNIPDYREIAGHLGVNLVHLTMRRGQVIYKEGEVAPRSAHDARRTW
ncbi:MAG TPA: amidohydrolase family protein [Bryobacteraceae bacterium]|nr:amidohydrolase family protein [Bryobacteraceae bacterium]